MEFKWHETKAKTNAKKHGVSFEEALTCFYDPHQVAFYDPEHSDDEDREILIAHSEKGRLLLVCYTIRHEVIRLISARLATKREVKTYEEGI
ncbi:MAG: BrnT family toxin [Gammaproteobacteria bacterium]